MKERKINNNQFRNSALASYKQKKKIQCCNNTSKYCNDKEKSQIRPTP